MARFQKRDKTHFNPCNNTGIFYNNYSGYCCALFNPGLQLAPAFVLGAIVSPPDAVAATSITKGLGLNRKVITIIEGESLVNDASALIAYRYAVAAAISGTFVLWEAGLQFLLVSFGGIAIGLIIGYIMVFAHKKISDNAIVETCLSLLTPFIAYLLAERIHSSGVLAVVTAGLLISWRAREVFSFQTRLQTNVVWNTLIFLMNGLVFILIGLQLPEIVKSFEGNGLYKIIAYGLVISVVTVVIRILWVFAGAYHQTVFKQKKADVVDETVPTSWKNVLIVAWTGTRGVVSLATALALPLTLQNGSPFPQRNAILLLAFIVILVTLVVQGLTLPLLIRLLKIKPEVKKQKQEEDDLQLNLSENTLHFIDRHFTLELDDNVLTQVRKRYEFNYKMLLNKNTDKSKEQRQYASQLNYANQLLLARREVINFQREIILKYHTEGTFNDETLTKYERELDIEELQINTMMEKTEEPDSGT